MFHFFSSTILVVGIVLNATIAKATDIPEQLQNVNIPVPAAFQKLCHGVSWAELKVSTYHTDEGKLVSSITFDCIQIVSDYLTIHLPTFEFEQIIYATPVFDSVTKTLSIDRRQSVYNLDQNGCDDQIQEQHGVLGDLPSEITHIQMIKLQLNKKNQITGSFSTILPKVGVQTFYLQPKKKIPTLPSISENINYYMYQ